MEKFMGASEQRVNKGEKRWPEWIMSASYLGPRNLPEDM